MTTTLCYLTISHFHTANHWDRAKVVVLFEKTSGMDIVNACDKRKKNCDLNVFAFGFCS